MNKIPADVARKIGHYVYLLIDPRTRKPFYVGKGRGSRALTHLVPEGKSRKNTMVARIRRAGLKPQIDILAHGLPDDETAFRVEAAAIDALGLDRLTNEVRGWRSIERGRMPLRQLMVYYSPRRATVRHPALLIRINRLYSHGMSKTALYEATRGIWRLSAARAKEARYALAVFEGVVREVYKIQAWHPAGTTEYETRKQSGLVDRHRIEFTGRIAPKAFRDLYLDRSVEKYFKRGQQSPVVYVRC